MATAAPPSPVFDKTGKTPKGPPFGSAAWLKAHQVEVGAAGVAAVVVVAVKARKTSSTSTSSGAATTTPVDSSTYDSTSVDQYNALEGAISQLQAEVTDLETPASPTTPKPTPKKPAPKKPAPKKPKPKPKKPVLGHKPGKGIGLNL